MWWRLVLPPRSFATRMRSPKRLQDSAPDKRQVRDLVRSLLKGREPVAKAAEPPTVEPQPFVSPIEVTPAGRPMRIFVVGDSHSLPMRDLLVRESFTGRDYLVVGKYITGFTAAGMMQDGELSAELVAALEGEHLL